MTTSNIKGAVVQSLKDHNTKAAALFQRRANLSNHNVETVVGMTRFWRTELSAIEGSTKVRQSLIEDVQEQEWMGLFNRDVLPFIIDKWSAEKKK